MILCRFTVHHLNGHQHHHHVLVPHEMAEVMGSMTHPQYEYRLMEKIEIPAGEAGIVLIIKYLLMDGESLVKRMKKRKTPNITIHESKPKLDLP